MSLKLKKIIMLIVSVCVITAVIISCNYNNGISNHSTRITETETIEKIKNVEDTKNPTSVKNTEIKTPEPTENTQVKENEKVDKVEKSTEKPKKDNKEVNNKKTKNKTKNSKSNLVNLGTFKLTAYCACSTCCGQWAGGNTASGTTPTANRTIAVDTSIIPFGTKIVINGNTYIAEDTGGAIKGNRIDVFFDSHHAALNFGVQYTEVYKMVS